MVNNGLPRRDSIPKKQQQGSALEEMVPACGICLFFVDIQHPETQIMWQLS